MLTPLPFSPSRLFFLGAVLVTGLPVACQRAELLPEPRPPVRSPVRIPGSPPMSRSTGSLLSGRHCAERNIRGWNRARAGRRRHDCGQECLAQLDPSPENVDRLLTKWYEGKSCAICTRALSPSDWRRSRLAVLNLKQKIFELRHMYPGELQATLREYAAAVLELPSGRARAASSSGSHPEGRSSRHWRRLLSKQLQPDKRTATRAVLFLLA